MFPKIQIDTSISYFLLKYFGERKFSGLDARHVEFWTELPKDKTTEQLEQEGYILIDLGLSRFDHHRLGPENNKYSSSHMVAKYLEIEDRPDLQKLLEFARRDDLEGKGTQSNDPIDRAFGLSGLLTNLNKSMPEKSREILEIIILLLEAHFAEENRRHELLPKEYNQMLNSNKVREFRGIQFGRQLKIIYMESDNPAMAGYVRSRAVGAHIVIQKASSGHTNFITQQQAKIQLKKLARLIKLLEAEKNNIILQIDSLEELEQSGRTKGLPHWYYDTRANTLQNGGINPQDIPPTKLVYKEIEDLVKEGLNIERTQDFNSKNLHRFSKGKGGVVYID
jgi:hypothetical protein